MTAAGPSRPVRRVPLEVRARPWIAMVCTCVLAAAAVAGLGWVMWPSPPEAAELHTGTARHLVTVAVDSPRRGGSAVELQVTDRAGVPSGQPDVTVDAAMPLMGHASPTVTAVPTGPGRYRVPEIHLMAPGPWELTVTVAPWNDAPDTVRIPLEVSG